MDDYYGPKNYFDAGATVAPRSDLGAERMERLRGGEVFTVLNDDGTPDRRILMDSFNTIRCSAIDNRSEHMARSFFAVPASPYHPNQIIDPKE